MIRLFHPKQTSPSFFLVTVRLWHSYGLFVEELYLWNFLAQKLTGGNCEKTSMILSISGDMNAVLCSNACLSSNFQVISGVKERALQFAKPYSRRLLKVKVLKSNRIFLFHYLILSSKRI
jgi:hypothetical protein